MALVYKPFQSTLENIDGDKLYYPRLVKFGSIVDTQKIGALIAEKSSVTPGDCHNVIRNLMSVMREQLLNGRSVRLDGLGTFTLVARAGGKGVKTAEEVNSTQITGLRCRFTPEYTRPAGSSNTTRALFDGVEYVKLSSITGEATGNTGNGSGNDDDDDGYVPDPNA